MAALARFGRMRRLDAERQDANNPSDPHKPRRYALASDNREARIVTPATVADGRWSAYAGLALTALFWAGNAVLARGVVGDIPPVALSFWRWVLALLLLLPLGMPRLWAQRRVLRDHWRAMLVIAALSVGAFNTLLYLAAVTTTALNITLLNTTIPVMVALLAWLLLRQRVTAYRGLGIVLGLLGMVIIVIEGNPERLYGLTFQPGDLIMLCAVVAWGLYTVFLRSHPIPLEPLAFLTAQVLLGLPVILPFYLLELHLTGAYAPVMLHIPVFLYVAIFPSLLALAFWNHGVKRVGPSGAAMFLYLIPVFAAVLAGVFLDERLQIFHATGGVLILAGLWLATREWPAPAHR